MSYDLLILGDGELDVEPDECEWIRGTVAATFVLTREEIGVGVVGDDAPAAERARDFGALLEVVMGMAERLGARVHDPQLGRDLTPADVPLAIRDFAGG